ncbi:MAG: sialidase family protein [Chthoniobacteraceae bacterium]
MKAALLVASILAIASVKAAEPELSDVFVAGRDGYKSIRIPSVVVTKAGVVLAFAEGRAANADQAANDLVLRRSIDGGRTWGAMQLVAEDGDNSLNNPCAVIVRETGRVFVMFQAYPAGASERSGEISWSPAMDVTRTTKRTGHVTTVASGPGIGTQLAHGEHAGRLIIPFNEGPFGLWSVFAVFSDDRGKTWRIGEPAPGGFLLDDKGGGKSTVNEVQMVERSDGSVLLNGRKWAGRAVRKKAVSADGGETWTTITDDVALHDPGCQASIFRYSESKAGGHSRILYSGPDSTRRENGTVRLSYDDGQTWPVKKVLHAASFGYSVLAAFPDGTIGCLFETDGEKRIVFARFTLDWLSDGKDTLKEP